jgi:hypothetical protein
VKPASWAFTSASTVANGATATLPEDDLLQPVRHGAQPGIEGLAQKLIGVPETLQPYLQSGMILKCAIDRITNRRVACAIEIGGQLFVRKDFQHWMFAALAGVWLRPSVWARRVRETRLMTVSRPVQRRLSSIHKLLTILYIQLSNRSASCTTSSTSWLLRAKASAKRRKRNSMAIHSERTCSLRVDMRLPRGRLELKYIPSRDRPIPSG